MLISKVEKNSSGKSFMVVDGQPFLYNTVQSWYPPEKDLTEYVKMTAKLEYKCFTFWLYWNFIEPADGEYDFREIDKVIDLAVQYDVRLDFLWSGTFFCDHMDPRWAPEWIYNDEKYRLKNEKGESLMVNGFDMGQCYAADPCNEELFEKEKRCTIALMDHLYEYDKTHRVILIQIQNEINLQGYYGGKTNVLQYINRLAKAIKESRYSIATRVNIAFSEMDSEIDGLEYVDGHGVDIYSMDVGITRASMLDPRNTRFKYIAENSAYVNSTAHIAAALASGGFYNIYRLDYDITWKKPGIYTSDWKQTPVASKIRDFNAAINKIGPLIAKTPKENMADFNNETNKQPFYDYKQRKMLGGEKIGMMCRESDAVGLIVFDEGTYYCVADSDAYFMVLNKDMICEAGYMSNNEWIKTEDKKIEKNSVSWHDNDYIVSYSAGECLKIDMKD